MQDGKLSYVIDLIKKLDADKENLPKDSWHDIKTVSLKAWCRRNDTRKIVDTEYNYGEVYVVRERLYIQHGSIKEEMIDKIFHNQLCECLKKEIEHFRTHDDYEVMKSTLKTKANLHNTLFGVHLSFSSNGKICVMNKDEEERPITTEEIKMLLEKYEKLEECLSNLTNEVNIVY